MSIALDASACTEPWAAEGSTKACIRSAELHERWYHEVRGARRIYLTFNLAGSECEWQARHVQYQN